MEYKILFEAFGVIVVVSVAVAVYNMYNELNDRNS